MTRATIYLDHGATTAVRPEAVAAMTDELGRLGNPSSLHGPGRAARTRLEEHRETIADALGATPSEVVLTSGGTESDNIAVIGTFRRRHRDDPARTRVLVGVLEHSAVLDSVQYLVDHEGAEVTWIECGPDGLVTPDHLAAALTAGGGPDTVALVSLMWVNNEIGVVQDIPALAAPAHEYGIPFHTDAVQAAGHVPLDFGTSGVDLMSVTGHKLGGPPGIGVLLARRDAPVEAVSYGGGQERRIRSGTLPIHLVAGLATALRIAVGERDAESKRLTELRDAILTGILERVPGTIVTGAWEPGDTTRRSPTNAHVLVPECEGDSLLFLLDAAGIACSTGSACHAGVPRPSHVVLALGHSEEEAAGAIRLTLGHTTIRADVDAVLDVIGECVERAQRAWHAGQARRAR
ncbi:cysteine desulfurase family protein [Mobilicoccus pelagius]|uniref:cysteine desulfurase n=1 Tax=Mobilicoccus pelagius NBRC 104925 TaxID=1089455 RepID=H5UQP7_9MICO|nr:cysteine desulfurase family protein [Mobilicoccus pelagius]GAB48055.1 cysteine desulfurase [Mobilicoccus pelagius NBRC 104925]